MGAQTPSGSVDYIVGVEKHQVAAVWGALRAASGSSARLFFNSFFVMLQKEPPARAIARQEHLQGLLATVLGCRAFGLEYGE